MAEIVKSTSEDGDRAHSLDAGERGGQWLRFCAKELSGRMSYTQRPSVGLEHQLLCTNRILTFTDLTEVKAAPHVRVLLLVHLNHLKFLQTSGKRRAPVFT